MDNFNTLYCLYMRKFLLLAMFACLGFAGFGQSNGTIKGKITDTLFKQDLSEATISILHAKDSTPVTFTIADAKGSFQIKDLDTGLYRLLITYQGYAPYSKNFMISKDFK